MPLLTAEDLHLSLPTEGGAIAPVDGVSFEIEAGECVGLVGESGCGKSTLGKTVMGIYTPTAGEIRFAGREIGRLPRRARRGVAKDLQYVYQDPGASLVEFFVESPFGPTLKSTVTARNIKQRLYVQTIDRHDLVFKALADPTRRHLLEQVGGRQSDDAAKNGNPWHQRLTVMAGELIFLQGLGGHDDDLTWSESFRNEAIKARRAGDLQNVEGVARLLGGCLDGNRRSERLEVEALLRAEGVGLGPERNHHDCIPPFA